jgi:cytochrome c
VKRIYLAVIFVCGFALLAISINLAATLPSGNYESFALADQATQTPEIQSTNGMSSILDRLAPPPTVYPPTQADLGQQTYYLVCMTCHGDRGQGLTDEFRALIGTPDSNCWQSHCHGSDPPRDGFVFPHLVPPVVGDVMRERFATALQLHDFIAKVMPYQAPGSLSPSDYWNLTAYLLRANGVEVNVAFLDKQTAQRISLAKPASQPTPKPLSLPVVIILILGLVILLVIIIRIYRPG